MHKMARDGRQLVKKNRTQRRNKPLCQIPEIEIKQYHKMVLIHTVKVWDSNKKEYPI